MKVTINAKTVGQLINGDTVNLYAENKEIVQTIRKVEAEALKIFISYSHKDNEIKDKLITHLAPLYRSGSIIAWSDSNILPGEEWDFKIRKSLDESSIILLLLSADFIISEYIWKSEVLPAIEKYEKKEAVVIPIMCRACMFDEMPYAKFQGLPKNMIPIADHANIDQVLTEIVKSIKIITNQLILRQA
ncbi:toll/interleukin-1 receptor domain-containing protein [Flavitalea sp.]|nr:toll/interleukin-1 receptor domain-containing protein [Flavitalea sp.]